MTNNVEHLNSVTNIERSLFFTGREIESFNKETQTISSGSIFLITEKTTPESVTFLIHGETENGQTDAPIYEQQITFDQLKELPIISSNIIKECKQNGGPCSYVFHKYSVLGKEIIWKETTEDMGFSHGYETDYKAYILDENKVNMAPFKNLTNISEGKRIDPQTKPTPNMDFGGVFMINQKDNKNTVEFHIQDRRVYGEQNPDCAYLNQSENDINALHPITLKEITAAENNSERWSNFHIFQAFNQTIVWREYVHRGGDFEGNDIYFYQYRLTETTLNNRTNL